MDDVVNRFARELADAIAAAVAENPQVWSLIVPVKYLVGRVPEM